MYRAGVSAVRDVVQCLPSSSQNGVPDCPCPSPTESEVRVGPHGATRRHDSLQWVGGLRPADGMSSQWLSGGSALMHPLEISGQPLQEPCSPWLGKPVSGPWNVNGLFTGHHIFSPMLSP